MTLDGFSTPEFDSTAITFSEQERDRIKQFAFLSVPLAGEFPLGSKGLPEPGSLFSYSALENLLAAAMPPGIDTIEMDISL